MFSNSKHQRRRRVSLLHSPQHTKLIHSTMQKVHQDRDLLLSSLLYYCGFIKDTPRFFTVHAPRIATRSHLEAFHSSDYLDLIEYSNTDQTITSNGSNKYENYHDACVGVEEKIINNETATKANAAYLNLLDAYGLTDDCPIPNDAEERSQLWKYCCSIAGASLHAASLLIDKEADVVINWSGGRHHAHADRAGGFCYVNDAVLAIQKLTRAKKRVLYLDIDIHHADGVQGAFYDTDEVFCVSLHRHAPGFFPPKSGSIHEKGRHKSRGVGYNLNIPMPRGCKDFDFLDMVHCVLTEIVPEYNPHVIVLCVGADGLKNDDLVKETGEGWNLSPEGIAECVRRISGLCGGIDYKTGKRVDSIQKRGLVVLGGGGYNPVNTARTMLLCTAAACESARPGMLWKELPTDIPQACPDFDRYGPSFELVSNNINIGSYYDPEQNNFAKSSDYWKTLKEGKQAVTLAKLFLSTKQPTGEASKIPDAMFHKFDDDESWVPSTDPKIMASCRRREGARRRKKCRI